MTDSRVIQLGNYLRHRREQLGWSARRLGRLSGLNYQTVTRIEQGEFDRPGPDKLKAMAEALDLDLTDVWAIIGYDTANELPAPLPYLRAKYRDLPEDDLDALSRDVARVLRAHGIDGGGRPVPGEDEFDDEPPLTASSPSKGGTS